MQSIPDPGSPGLFEARYLAFLETVTHLRPSLHRYCARMTGSVFDGEDVAQEALFQAYRKLDTFDDNQPLQPWLFRIAHNRCVDFLRRRAVRESAEEELDAPDSTEPVEPAGPLGTAVEHLVRTLPPKERAAVLLKDVFDYSLEEIAEMVDSTIGGVKAALSRGRTKLASHPPPVAPSQQVDAQQVRLLQLYADRFNRRDWDGVRELITADARLRVADGFLGPLSESPYFTRWEIWPKQWRLAVGEAEGAPVIVILVTEGDRGWAPAGIVRFHVADGRIRHIDHYLHCRWVLDSSGVVIRGWQTT